MGLGLKTKKGMWVKPGGGHSYRGYMYVRAAPKEYPTKPHQHKIGDIGRKIAEECKGKSGTDWKICRGNILRAARK